MLQNEICYEFMFQKKNNVDLSRCVKFIEDNRLHKTPTINIPHDLVIYFPPQYQKDITVVLFQHLMSLH